MSEADPNIDYDNADVFRDYGIAARPQAFFEHLRSKGPIVPLGYRNVIAVTGYDEGNAVFRDDENFSAINTVTGPYLPLDYDPHRSMDEQIDQCRDGNAFLSSVMSEDTAAHEKSKAILNGIITPARMKANEAYMYEMADRIIDGFIDKGRFDVVGDFGKPFAQFVIAELIGVPEADRATVCEMKADPNQMPGNLGGGFDMSANPLMRLGMQFYGYVLDRRANPQDDVLTRLCQQKYDDGTLPPPEAVVAVATFLFGAGQDTTVQLFAGMLRLLADNPGLEDRLRAEPTLIPDFVDEALRVEGVTKSTFRYVRNRVTVGDFTFEPGQHVMINIAAMNRDPRKFENPGAFDATRKGVRQHVAFGRGLHACAGGPLARAEGRVAIERLLARCRNFRIDEGSHGPAGDRHYDYLPNYSLYGVLEQQMTFERA
ncbi:MAG: cytochrome P450 [Sphingomonadales bacterium]|nr:cytochrome P450 [Sphingomonadales bacterium]